MKWLVMNVLFGLGRNRIYCIWSSSCLKTESNNPKINMENKDFKNQRTKSENAY